MSSQGGLISTDSTRANKQEKICCPVTCWFWNWKWSTELLLPTSLIRVWPRRAVTESSLLSNYLEAAPGAGSARSRLAACVRFLRPRSGSVWWAWSRMPQEGRQMYDRKTTETEVASPERCPLGRKVVTRWQSGVGGAVTPCSCPWMRRAPTLAELVSLVGPVFAQT